MKLLIAGGVLKEFKGYSQWDEANVRVDRTKEGLELILKFWESDGANGRSSRVSFNGNYHSADNAVLDPKLIQKPPSADVWWLRQ
jgi:alkanesulfonate monooxygenase SsuD/methylene tetrahydromethanopterin reductase-like flavin-dependent oxidoreductase (luciferase family)